MNTGLVLESLAALLAYPGRESLRDADACCDALEREIAGRVHGTVSENLRRYRTALGIFSAQELEELYTRTFDLNPVCSLDIGWHLYAENYDRGTFLVEMRNALKEHGISESTELPDHLPTVLRLLARMEPDRAKALAGASVLPAVRIMTTGFTDPANPYAALTAILEPLLVTTLDLESGVLAHDDHR
ncbi:MAG: nitrate reductase molybdenum cofactor assembly chaperone [Ignavibacterium sp.]|jgi:nitrate reductase delta subunit